MSEIQGLGSCGICMQPIQDAKTGLASPIRHFAGHLLAHQRCHEELEEYKKTDDYKVQQLKLEIGILTNKLNSAQRELDAAKSQLTSLQPDTES